jgi:hypothetical protein
MAAKKKVLKSMKIVKFYPPFNRDEGVEEYVNKHTAGL